jgi:hypothetical protein
LPHDLPTSIIWASPSEHFYTEAAKISRDLKDKDNDNFEQKSAVKFHLHDKKRQITFSDHSELNSERPHIYSDKYFNYLNDEIQKTTVSLWDNKKEKFIRRRVRNLLAAEAERVYEAPSAETQGK